MHPSKSALISQPVNSYEKSRNAQQQFFETMDSMDEGIQIVDFNWRYMYVNEALCRHGKKSKEELLGYSMMEKYPGIESATFFKVLQECMSERKSLRTEMEFVYVDNSKCWFDLKVEPVEEGIIIFSSDISIHKAAQEKLNKVNHLYAFMSQVNQNIVRVRDESMLFHNSCRIAHEYGKFEIAWIGLFDTPTQTVSLIDQFGMDEEDIQFFINAPFQTKGPLDSVKQTGENYFCNDVENEPSLKNWRTFAKKYDIHSLMILPIKKSGAIIGVFSLYSKEPFSSEKEEIALLEEIARDISFALDMFENAKQQKETESRLIKNESRFRALIEKSADLKTMTNLEGKFIYGSPSITKAFGYSSDEFLYRYSPDFFHPEDVLDFIEKRKLILETPGKSFSFQYRFLHKNGNWIWCEGTLTNMLEEFGINALVSNFRDISERKRAEQLLQKSEAFNLGVLNSLNSHIAVIDALGNIIAVNDSWKRFTSENSHSDIANTGVGANYIEVCFRSAKNGVVEAEKVLNGIKNIMEEKQSAFYLEYPCHSAEQERWFGLRIIKFNPDEPMLVLTHQNITERKLAEKNLAHSEASLKEAQAISHIGNWELDFTKNIHTWSDELYTIFGVSKEESSPSTEFFLSFMHPEDVDIIRVKVLEAFNTLRASSYNFRFIRKDGSVRYGYTERKFEFDKNNKPLRLVGVVQDITERKLAEEEREKMISDISQRSKNLQQFNYIISHNLRGPIANILGISNVLKGKLSDTERTRIQEYIFTAVSQLDETVKDLNKILQTGAQISEINEVVFFSELIKIIESSIQNLILKETIQIQYDFSEIDSTRTIKSYIYSIFYNLISNAIKYKQRHKEAVIQIKSELVKDKIRISFKDNGTGINLKEHGEKLFGLYNRFHHNIEGKGLGLFMVKTQLEALGGSIRVESEPGVGTEFIIELPQQP